ncbi:cysteine desulfurase family protein [Clostridium intestinale]|uniref:cysteine desulfurase family protein n=1 Tax=Clostridium intestinale TaxID=36845 RepID=UPI002DD65CA4|nr:cysteine desulfurase family protein [Clostridium intestinale]WRY51868.1 cysteine desulfurase family protein [Clostridium intestinale]
MSIYFDNAATTPPTEEVIESVVVGMKEYYGNPSSLHKLGLNAERMLLTSREELAKTINATSDEIFFTSGGSEGNNFILKGIGKSGNNIITTKFEHPSVLNALNELREQGIIVHELSLNENGEVDLEELKSFIDKNTVLVSIMHVNNEIGTIQPIEEIGKIIKDNSTRAKFHVDGVQSYGKIAIDVKKANIDYLTVSSHKFHGPKGVGFCYIRKGLRLKPLISGGGQESGFRSGTENLPGVMGMVVAAKMAQASIKESYKKVWEIKEHFIEKLKGIENIKINSPQKENISPYILNVSFTGIRGEVLLHALEENGIFVSTGSACSSRGGKESHVLKALGLDYKDIDGAIRFSFSRFNTIEEVDLSNEALKKSLLFLRRVRK